MINLCKKVNISIKLKKSNFSDFNIIVSFTIFIKSLKNSLVNIIEARVRIELAVLVSLSLLVQAFIALDEDLNENTILGVEKVATRFLEATS